MKPWISIAVSLMLLVCLLAPAARTFPLPGGIPVIDAANLSENIIQVAKMVAQIALQTSTLAQIKQHYDHAIKMATGILNAVRIVQYKIPTVVWRGISAIDRTGRLGRWIGAINSGVGTVEGWDLAGIPRVRIPIIINAFPSALQPRAEHALAAIDLQDGTGVAAMDTIGRIRLAGPLAETSLRQIETDILSLAAGAQTEAAHAEKANAIQMVMARQMADQQKLLVAHTEISLQRLKAERDAALVALQDEAALRTRGGAALAAFHGDPSAEMMAYRLP